MTGSSVFASLYDSLLWLPERMGLARIRGRLLANASGKVLEIGVGTGHNLPYYRTPQVTEVFAVDPSPVMLDRARKRARNLKIPVNLLQGSAEALPFQDEEFDTVVATLVFCSIPHPEKALQEVKRVLKSQGKLILLEHVKSRNTYIASAQSTIRPMWCKCFGGCRPDQDTLSLLEEVGFAVESLRYHWGDLVFEAEATK